jgi:prepilin-type N-terminal cleavage/methylation domain-containing protein
MLQKLHKSRGGFTLVEIMIVVAIIALLAAIAVPGFIRARKRSQASRILEDLRLIDAAIDQYAIETNKSTGAAVNWDPDIKNYLKPNSQLYTTGASVISQDYTKGTNGAWTVDATIFTPTNTQTALGDVAPKEFWLPFTLQ